MTTWLFRVVFDRACVPHFPTSRERAPPDSPLICRILFDGKEANLDVAPAPHHAAASKPVAFKYRIRASTWKDLAAAFSQRRACLQVMCLDAAEEEAARDADLNEDSVVGIASIDLLSLAQNVTAQYELPLRAPDAGSDTTKLGRLSVCITMEQLCDFRMQLKEMRASGLETGAYKLRYFLSASSVYVCSSESRSKLGSATWTNGTLQELLFQGTLRALASRDFTISLLKSGENGRGPPVAIFTVSLLQVQANASETVREIPFLLEDPESPAILSGVLQLSELPVFQQNIRLLPTACRSYTCDEARNKWRRPDAVAALGQSYEAATPTAPLQRAPASGEATARVIDLPTAPPPAPLGAVPAAATLGQAVDEAPARPPLGEGGGSARAGLAHSGSSTSCSDVCGLRSPPREEDSRSYTQPLNGAALAHEWSLPQEQGGRDGGATASASPPPRFTATDITEASELSLHFAGTKEDKLLQKEQEEKGERHHLTAFYGTLQRETQQQQQQHDEAGKEEEEGDCKQLMHSVYHLLQELDCVEERIVILQECLENTCMLPGSADNDAATQIGALEQQLSELGMAETTLMQLEARLQERFRLCAEQYRTSEAEFRASVRRLEVYAEVLINIDRGVSAEMQGEELGEPSPKGTAAICHPPRPPCTPKPTWR
ncbi:uncharacterized protein Tco025E_05629 [Trypanosoma conorhini]|uniref:Uncharacterized protein n=1 Tax=Trypanosoma conorhini TaxID=83891 RepID=A0A3R7RXB0_9TRYP|nr:uncharacterized protein Tco025E_05629 [Trypanosoma conorhini]RNF15063.1 hypothetical protein Tco025E_05629 [Trypanosoma conorhini]